jgi:hypothetical protein
MKQWKTAQNLHIENIHVSSSSNIIKILKSRSMRWEEHITRTGEKSGVCRILEGNHERKTSVR